MQNPNTISFSRLELATPTGQGESPIGIEAAQAPKSPNFRPMEGWFREVTITGSERRPLKTQAEVTNQWGLPFGDEVGQVILPGREKVVDLPLGQDPEVTLPFQPTPSQATLEDESLRTLHVFDARPRKGGAPRFVVASQSALRKIAAAPPRLRGIIARLSRDVHYLYEGDRLKLGTNSGRWLPSRLARREERANRQQGHQNRKVISDEQTRFYVGDDGELHVRSEGYNPDILVAHPTNIEQEHVASNVAYARGLEEQLRLTAGQRTEQLPGIPAASRGQDELSTQAQYVYSDGRESLNHGEVPSLRDVIIQT